MKKIIIVHGWGASPQAKNSWRYWLKKELEKRDIIVLSPTMPNSEGPIIEKWVRKLKEVAQNVDEQTYFVGHSIGVQTILRYLESLKDDTKVGGCIFVAGWFDLLETAYEEPEKERPIAKPWIKTPIDFEKVKLHCNKFISIFSDNDYCVDVKQSKIFEEKLNSEIIIEKNKGHFSKEDGVKELPLVLEKIQEMTA